MKKFTLLLLSVFMVSAISAQMFTKQNVVLGKKVDIAPMESAKAISDTLGLYEFFSATNIFSSSSVSNTNSQVYMGSMSGTNYILDSVAGTVVGDPSTYVYQGKYWTEEVGMGYICTSGYIINGMLFYYSHLEGPNGITATSNIGINLYELDNPVSFGGQTFNAPGTLLANDTLNLSTLAPAGTTWSSVAHYVPFVNSISVINDFALCIDLSNCYNAGDLFFTYVGDDAALYGAGTDYSFFKLGAGFSTSGDWYTYDMFYVGGTNMALSIFAVINMSGMDEFFQGVKLGNVYPNPSISGTSTKIDFELENAGEVNGYVLDMNGKVIQEFNEGSLSAGAHTLTLNSNLPAASYICSIFTNGKNSSQIFIVE